MRFFTASFDQVLTRYFLMMAVVIIGGFSGFPLLGLLALPLFLSAILGISFGAEDKARASAKEVQLRAARKAKKTAA